MGATLSTWNTKNEFPHKCSLWMFTNTNQPSCLGVNYIWPMQSMWENCNPQTYSHRIRSYTWRHNEDLEIFIEAAQICCETANKALNNITNRAIHFVKEGIISKLQRKNKHRSTLPDGCTEWYIAIYLENHFVFSIEIALTTQRPDIVIWSVKSFKKVFVIELTVPFEENFDWSHQPKLEKYEDLREQCVRND